MNVKSIKIEAQLCSSCYSNYYSMHISLHALTERMFIVSIPHFIERDENVVVVFVYSMKSSKFQLEFKAKLICLARNQGSIARTRRFPECSYTALATANQNRKKIGEKNPQTLNISNR